MRQARLQREIQWLLKEKYKGISGPAFLRDAERLKRGEPADYVIGFAEFLGCRIDLSKKPLIPRPETEYWVGEAIKELKEKYAKKKIRCLDIFAGSGCIGAALLGHLPGAVVDFAEREPAYCAQIKINLKRNAVLKSRYSVIESDLFSRVKKRYHAIFANPPYVAKKHMRDVQKSVLRWEPKKALFGGEDGLWYIRKFLGEAASHLLPGGIVWMEFDPRQKAAIQRIANICGYSNICFFKDQYTQWRFLKIWI